MTFRRVLIALTIVAAIFTAPLPAQARETTRDLRVRMLQLVNRSRRTYGEHGLRLNLNLSWFAYVHSARMAGSRTLYHAGDVGGKVSRYGARVWGENVGMSYRLSALERAFMLSPEHRANILALRYHRIGIGVVHRASGYWVTLDFYG
jgi:uncharacterized protein YkwD